MQLPNLSPQLSAKLAALGDRCVRQLIAVFPRVSRCPHCFENLESPRNQFYGDDKVTALRVLIGVCAQRAAQYGAEDNQATRNLLPVGYGIPAGSPEATTKEDPRYPEDATTQPFRPGKNPLRPRSALPPLPKPPDLGDE